MPISREEIGNIRNRHIQVKELILKSEIGFTPDDVIDDEIGKLKFPLDEVKLSLSRLYNSSTIDKTVKGGIEYYHRF